jgi:hypothetical protein
MDKKNKNIKKQINNIKYSEEEIELAKVIKNKFKEIEKDYQKQLSVLDKKVRDEKLKNLQAIKQRIAAI